jgi:2-desacetyl-2-hydroxyethyl bacteriochlorophyllide A dehydrogenase
MRAFIINKPYKAVIGEMEKPEPGPDEILVAVRACGICAGDMYAYTGKNPYAVYPAICGHEIAGVIAEVGTEVEGWEPGQRVVVEPFIGCGTCYPCRVGKANCCASLQIVGAHIPGGYAEYVKAPANLIHIIPEGLDFTWAAFAEPVAIGVQACRRGGVKAEDVLILGCGPIGLACIEVARAKGARVTATDIAPNRIASARAFGAESLTADEYLTERVLELTNGEGFPVVIEATGNPEAMESTVDLVAAGGRIVILGLLKQGVRVSFPGLDFTRKEMTIVGSRASVNCFPDALNLMASGAITYPQVATELSMWDAPQVFADLAEDPALAQKGVLVIED